MTMIITIMMNLFSGKRYKKWNAQKASLNKELLPTPWHPDCVKDWCMSEDEKRQWTLRIVVFSYLT